jgi:hypothetical protein
MLGNDEAVKPALLRSTINDLPIVSALQEKFGDAALAVAERQLAMAATNGSNLETWSRIVTALRPAAL